MSIDNEAHYYHAMAIATHSGYATIKKYRAVGGGNWKAAYEALKQDGGALRQNSEMLDDIVPPDPHEVYEKMETLGVRLVLDSDREFPEVLRHIPYPPFGIYIRGAAIPSNASAFAIVGTRRASADGKKTARAFSSALAAAGFTIASGLAFGIDAAAHVGALDAHIAGDASGVTVAVLAGGLETIYPHSHRALAEKILEHDGALISEYPPGEMPFGYRFIERNRIISGISRGVLIVEAPESSGALATARYAVEQNRDVFVVPGAVSTANFKGSHALIRQGAELVSSPDDIFETYGIDRKKNIAGLSIASSPEEILILKALAEISAPVDVDKLIAMTRLEPRTVNQALSFLLLRGNIKEFGGGYTI